MKRVGRTMQWAIFIVIVTWGLLSFLLLAGEDNPNEPLPMMTFILIKIGAMLSLALSVWVGRILTKAGYMPNLPEED